MPRYSAIFALVIFAAAAFADVVPTVQWDVETGRLTPVPYALSIRRGESVNIQPRFLTYNSPMVLTGSTVQLRYWYTGQTGYYATTGSLMAATGRVHVAWYDALCPASNALNYEVRVTIGTNVLARGYGPLSLLTGTSGTETNGQVRTSINWSLIDQTGGSAVLSNQMGSGAAWSGSAWTFATADMSWSNDYYRVSNPSNYITATVTNGLYPSSNPSNYAPASVTNGLLPAAATNGWEVGIHTDLLPTAATNGAEWGSHASLMPLLGGTLPYDGAIFTLRGTNSAYSPFLMLFNDQGNNAGLRFQNGGSVSVDIVLDEGVLKRSSEEGLYALLDESFGAIGAETATNIAMAIVAPHTNQVTPQSIASAGGLTNIPAVITPVTLSVGGGNTATVEAVHYYDLGGLATNVTVVIGASMTNTAQARSFWLDWTNTAFSLTFPAASFSNITANTATTNGAYSSFWHAGKGQSIFRGGWR